MNSDRVLMPVVAAGAAGGVTWASSHDAGQTSFVVALALLLTVVVHPLAARALRRRRG